MINVFTLSDEAFDRFLNYIDQLTVDDIPLIEKLIED